MYLSNKYLSKINYTYLTPSLPLAPCPSSLGNLFCTITYHFLLVLNSNAANVNERNGNKRLEKLNALLQMLVSKVVSF
jgi:hypothetical protein